MRRYIAIILLSLYSLIATCGCSLHILTGDGHVGSDKNSEDESDHHDPDSPLAEHSDCLICELVRQGQLFIGSDLVLPEATLIAKVELKSLVDYLGPDRRFRACRSPPYLLV